MRSYLIIRVIEEAIARYVDFNMAWECVGLQIDIETDFKPLTNKHDVLMSIDSAYLTEVSKFCDLPLEIPFIRELSTSISK